jgi:hypothetical protein
MNIESGYTLWKTIEKMEVGDRFIIKKNSYTGGFKGG